MRLSVFLVLLAIAPAAWCQAAGQDEERSPLDLIESCSDAAGDDTTGLTALEEKCPGLTNALEQSGYLPLLSTAQRDTLDSYDLSDLLAVDDWYAEDDSAADELDVGTLGPILDSLRAQEPERPLTWFERFKRWLRSMAERQQGDSDNWLTRWLENTKLGDKVAIILLYGALGVILALTILVIVNELRAAGVFRQRPASDADSVASGTAAVEDDAAVDLDSLPVDRKASMLLRMLVTTLVQSGRLRTERSLTHRELSARATFDDAGQRESFQRVAALAERTVYGSHEAPPSEVEPIVAAARALDAQLRGAAA
ncbi:MAG TPA: hypothetical protein VJT80_18255 [Steroidobacteraceae bacterium]|nr:hypothetical protein [Steroidobacteraceae bacterium]